MIKVHDLTPDYFHYHYSLNEGKATLISDYCWMLGIPFSFDEDSYLCEVELSQDSEDPNQLHSIDWDYLHKNTSKKLIITHRHILRLDLFIELLNELVIKYDMKDRVFWYTHNPVEFKFLKDINFKLLYVPVLTNHYCEGSLLSVYRARVHGLDTSKYYNKDNLYMGAPQYDFSSVDSYYLSTSFSSKSHRVLATYLLREKIGFSKGRVSFIGDKHANRENMAGYLFEYQNELAEKGIDINEVLKLENLKLSLDIDLENIPKDVFNGTCETSLLEQFKRSLINYVHESTANENEIFMTEKTFTNFMVGRPFLINGSKGSLQYLKRYHKFKTFDRLFDESYDMKDNYIDRVYYAVEELEKFCKLPFEIALAKVQALSDVYEHNRKTYLNIDHKGTFFKIINGI